MTANGNVDVGVLLILRWQRRDDDARDIRVRTELLSARGEGAHAIEERLRVRGRGLRERDGDDGLIVALIDRLRRRIREAVVRRFIDLVFLRARNCVPLHAVHRSYPR